MNRSALGMDLQFSMQDQLRMQVKRMLDCVIEEESGQDLIEYALVAALVGLGAVSTLNGLANAVTNTFGNISNTLANSV